MGPAERALELARESGFDLAGIAPFRPPRDAERFAEWIEAGRHAALAYLERDLDRILDPRRWAPQGRCLLIVGLAHSRAAVELPGGGRVARYAGGRDYHNVLLRKLRKLRVRLTAEGLIRRESFTRVGTDAIPLLERSHAAEAGLGFPSKAANLLHPAFGPWFFLGELILDLDLAPTTTPPAGSCGTCRACLDACPTQAITAPGVVDARLCISYHTIESREPIPRELRANVGPWAFGCDVCSEICPWGARAPDLAERWGTHPALAGQDLVGWLELESDEQLAREFEGSPLQRPRRAGLARNAAIALGNSEEHEAERALLQALSSDSAPMVREAAAWALARTRGREPRIRLALEQAAAREIDEAAEDGMRRSLAGEP